MRKLIFAILCVGLIFTNTVFATASTHIWAPSTDIQPFNLWHITWDGYLPAQLDKDAQGNGTRLAPVTNLGITTGILPFQKVQMELGIDHKAGLSTADKYPMYVNAKVGIPEGTFGKHFPAIAAGGFDFGTKADVTDYNVLYAKVAKTFPTIGKISVGYFSGNKKLLLNKNGEKDNAGPMVAWERTMPEISDKLWLCVDYMGTKSAYGTLNLGFSWKCADNISILCGYDIVNDKDLTGVENCVTVQADIDLRCFGCK